MKIKLKEINKKVNDCIVCMKYKTQNFHVFIVYVTSTWGALIFIKIHI